MPIELQLCFWKFLKFQEIVFAELRGAWASAIPKLVSEEYEEGVNIR